MYNQTTVTALNHVIKAKTLTSSLKHVCVLMKMLGSCLLNMCFAHYEKTFYLNYDSEIN